MKGFTKIESPEDLRPGDVLLLPPGIRALHAAPSTLSKHGLSSGDTCRSANDARLVARIFSATGETGAALMVSTADIVDVASTTPVSRGANTLDAYAPPRRKIRAVYAHMLDDDLLPMYVYGSDEGAAVLSCVKPLTDAVHKRFMEVAPPEAYSAIETSEWMLRSHPKAPAWRALKLATEPPFSTGPESAMPMVPVQPLDASDTRTAVTRRLLCSDNVYRPNSTKANTLTMVEKTVLHLISHGMEIHRPDPDTWALLAEKVLERHARQAVKQILRTQKTIANFTETMKADLEKFHKMADWWEGRSAELSAKRSYVKSPYRQRKA